MLPIRFYFDERGFPRFETADDRWTFLGVWFVMELRNSPYQVLDLLGIVDDVAAGRSGLQEWEGEGVLATVTKDGVVARNTFLQTTGTYGLQELTEAAESYWRNVSTVKHLQADLADWEKTWKRTHPYRGRLF